jgi:hypothetical protein
VLTEHLAKHDEVRQVLVGHATSLARAERDAAWTPWLMRRLERVGETGEHALEHVFGAVGAVGEGLGEGLGGIGQGLGDGVGGVGKGLGDATKIVAGVVSVGAVVIAGIWVLRR